MPTKRRKIGARRRSCSAEMARWVGSGELPRDDGGETFLQTPPPLRPDAPRLLRQLWESAGGTEVIRWSRFLRREGWRIRSA